MIALFLSKYWKHILAVCLIVGAAISLVYSLYSWGYDNCKEDWDAAIKDRDRIQGEQTTEIRLLSKKLSDTSDALQAQSNENLTTILLTVKNKPMYRIVEGKCIPSKEFEKAYLDIIGLPQ